MGRFYIVFYLFLTTAIIYGFKKLPNRFMWLLGIILIFVIFERIPSGFYLSAIPDEHFITVVKSLDSTAVLDLPIIDQNEGTRQKSDYDLYSIYYHKPIVNGYVQWLGDTPDSEIFLNLFSDLECGTQTEIYKTEISDTMLPALNNNGIKTIVFHKVLEPLDRGPDACDQALSNIDIFLNRSGIPIKKVYEDETTAVFQLR